MGYKFVCENLRYHFSGRKYSTDHVNCLKASSSHAQGSSRRTRPSRQLHNVKTLYRFKSPTPPAIPGLFDLKLTDEPLIPEVSTLSKSALIRGRQFHRVRRRLQHLNRQQLYEGVFSLHVLVGSFKRPPLRKSVALPEIALLSLVSAARAVNPKPLHSSLDR